MAAWGKADDIAFLTTPNSITGQLIPRAEIEKIARIALLKRRFLVIDEAFIDFVEEESVKQLIRDNPYVIILRSLPNTMLCRDFVSAIFSLTLEQSRNSPLI